MEYKTFLAGTASMITFPFNQSLRTEAELRALLGEPSHLVQNKSISFIDSHCKDFIALSPILFLATADATGHCDVSPRGDQAGFVQVLDHQHLLIPERPGNKRADALRNILSNPHIGLIFIVPGLEETLRINGKACITQDQELLSSVSAQGRIPQVGIGVQVEECFIHCAKSFKRSNLFDFASWPEKDRLPSAAQIVADHVNTPEVTEASVDQALQESYEKRLY
jgi:PPOX class probable FMN-dependent enzyme